MIASWQQLIELSNDNSACLDLKYRQEEWLLKCLSRNQQTCFGKEHCFNEIHSIEDYRNQVPLAHYQAFNDYVENIEKGEAEQLFSGPIVAFEITTGSSQAHKLIPYSAESLFDFQRAIVPWLSSLAETYQITSGSAYWSISPATRQREITWSGVPIGLSDAEYLGEQLTPFFLQVSAVPTWVGEIKEVADWQIATLYHLLCRRDLALISVWSPTFLLTLLDAINDQRSALETVLLNGGIIQEHKLEAQADVYQQLSQFYTTGDHQMLWPDLKVISCWADASSKPFCEMLKLKFPDVAIQGKGLLMTEGVVTTPNRNNQTLLTADSGFYEFINDDQQIFLAHELEVGKSYELVMTTAGGLYRYRTADRLICDGYSEEIPILRFCGRNSVSDMVGEKLTEEFVTNCLNGINGFRMLLPIENKTPAYCLIVDQFQETDDAINIVENRLYENPHYAYARKLRQLGPLNQLKLADPLKIYTSSPEHLGSRLGDIKVPSLCIKPAIFKDFIGNTP